MHAADGKAGVTGSIADLRRELTLFGQFDIFAKAKGIARLFGGQRTLRFKTHHLRVAVKHRRLNNVCGDHQAIILQDFADLIDNTALFTHASFTIGQQRQHIERQLTAEEIIFIDRNTVKQFGALPREGIDRFFTVSGSGKQAGHADTRQAAPIDQRFQRRQQLAGQAIRDRDNVTIAVIRQYERVNIRHHQRHVRLQRKQTA